MSIPNPSIFFDKIEEFDSIITVGHVRPDGDAYGSAMGLKLAIDGLYSNKKTYAILDEVHGVPESWPKTIKPGTLDEKIIKNSLAIIVDTGTVERIADKRVLNAKYVIKIDHHPGIEHFGDIEYVDDKKVANALIIADILFSRFPVIPSNASDALLLGIITDSGNFRFSNDSDSFAKAGRLIADGANIRKIYDSLYTLSLEDLKLKSYLLSKLETQGVLAYSVFSVEEADQFHRNADSLAPLVNTIGFTKECPVWAYFAEYPNHSYRAEFRCSDQYDVSEAALKLGGGGHQQASGAALKDKQAVLDAIELLSKLKPIK